MSDDMSKQERSSEIEATVESKPVQTFAEQMSSSLSSQAPRFFPVAPFHSQFDSFTNIPYHHPILPSHDATDGLTSMAQARSWLRPNLNAAGMAGDEDAQSASQRPTFTHSSSDPRQVVHAPDLQNHFFVPFAVTAQYPTVFGYQEQFDVSGLQQATPYGHSRHASTAHHTPGMAGSYASVDMARLLPMRSHKDLARHRRDPDRPLDPLEAATSVAFPRGPPRKPRQTGHALWVGNLPRDTRVTDLKDHFSRDATNDIESVFLISKSNCAFVNYRSELACLAALDRFRDSIFEGARLVCRLRRNPSESNTIRLPESDLPSVPLAPEAHVSRGGQSPTDKDQNSAPVIVGSSTGPADASGHLDTEKVDEMKSLDRFFIIKSLTIQDLEASVRNGTWATQPHNEGTLNQAYKEADNVYLVFSANRSGEYFGYARMMSLIPEESERPKSAHQLGDWTQEGSPRTVATPATATAPDGRIIDDSARGTIFWEAWPLERARQPTAAAGFDAAGDQQWGRQFQIAWLSTAPLPFYRTRGLRNSFNANREIKVARDGTEIEPNVGRWLIQLFHGPAVFKRDFNVPHP